MGEGAVEFRQLTPAHAPALGAFLEQLASAGDEAFFHPHALTAAHAHELSARATRDLYYVATLADEVIAYGMLRGWDEGWEVPSLGIAVHAQWRGRGLAEAFMRFLHVAARGRGAKRVRLKVTNANERAVRLYERCGYRFEPLNETERVGFLEL